MNNAQNVMQELLDSLVAEDKEQGLQVAVYHRGELIVDAWAGIANPATGALVDGDTIFPVFSTTKGIAATVIHRLAEHGLLDYDMPIASVWPEFAAQGKENITLRQAMSHMAGLPHIPLGLSYVEILDWNAICNALANAKPAWEPGKQMEYHAITYGWLLGEVAQRVTGHSFSRLVQQEICQPLGIETLFVGLPYGMDDKVAVLEEVSNEAPPAEPTKEETPATEDDTPQAETPQSVPSWIGPLYEMMNRPDARHACMPGANGIMSARAIARHYASLLPGGVDGVELLPPSRIRLATELQQPAGVPLEELPLRMGLGYGLMGELPVKDGRVPAFGHGGHGGSLGYADPENQLAFGFTRNRFSPEPTSQTLMEALKEVLKESS